MDEEKKNAVVKLIEFISKVDITISQLTDVVKGDITDDKSSQTIIDRAIDTIEENKKDKQ